MKRPRDVQPATWALLLARAETDGLIIEGSRLSGSIRHFRCLCLCNKPIAGQRQGDHIEIPVATRFVCRTR